MTTMLEAAHWWAAQGFPVLPLEPRGKQPLHGLTGGYKVATTDQQQITRWWSRMPRANIGIRPPDNVAVLDIDPRNNGERDWQKLTGGHQVPATLTTYSGRGDGGRHLFFHQPDHARLVNKFGSGIDLKTGATGYVVAPPSIHPDSCQPYTLDWKPIATIPDWLLHPLLVIETPQPRRTPVLHRKAGDKSAGLIRTVAEATEGNRNAALFWAACRAYEDDLDLDEQLEQAGEGVGLNPTEIAATLRSARTTIQQTA